MPISLPLQLYANDSSDEISQDSCSSLRLTLQILRRFSAASLRDSQPLQPSDVLGSVACESNPETPKPLRCFLIKCVRFIAYKYNRLSFVLVRMNLLPKPLLPKKFTNQALSGL